MGKSVKQISKGQQQQKYKKNFFLFKYKNSKKKLYKVTKLTHLGKLDHKKENTIKGDLIYFPQEGEYN